MRKREHCRASRGGTAQAELSEFLNLGNLAPFDFVKIPTFSFCKPLHSTLLILLFNIINIYSVVATRMMKNSKKSSRLNFITDQSLVYESNNEKLGACQHRVSVFRISTELRKFKIGEETLCK